MHEKSAFVCKIKVDKVRTMYYVTKNKFLVYP